MERISRNALFQSVTKDATDGRIYFGLKVNDIKFVFS